jgi:beta propeller repeat protein
MKLILSLLFTVTIMVFGPLAGADTTISQVTSNSYKDSHPQIKADYLVWQGYVGGDWEIFLYNIATEETMQITDNTYDDVLPQTDGSYIVWQGFNDGEWDIFLWDGTEIQAISDRSAEDLSPQIANGVLVWTIQPFGDDFVGRSEVILYDAGTQTLSALSEDVDPNNSLDDSAPKINDEVVIWVQTDDQDNTTLYMYDLSNGTMTENPDYVWRDSPQRDGNLSVLIRHDSHDWEIFLYNSESRRYHQITDNILHDSYPSISRNYVSWTAGEEIFVAECKYLSLINPGDSAILSEILPPTFTWEGIGYDRFNVEFSEDPDFLSGNVLTLSVGEETLPSETFLTPTESDWGAIRTIEQENGRAYWRVEGKASDGSVSYSETWSFMIQEDGVTATATTTGGSGANTRGGGDSGPCFIGTAAH